MPRSTALTPASEDSRSPPLGDTEGHVCYSGGQHAGIEPPSGPYPGTTRETLADPRQIAVAVSFLARQGARAASHELVLTPLAERWVP